MGVWNCIEPLYMVAIQLNILNGDSYDHGSCGVGMGTNVYWMLQIGQWESGRFQRSCQFELGVES